MQWLEKHPERQRIQQLQQQRSQLVADVLGGRHDREEGRQRLDEINQTIAVLYQGK